MEEDMLVTRQTKTFYFDFDLHKDVDKNLKHDIKFIRKSNKSLAENKTKKRDWTIVVQT